MEYHSKHIFTENLGKSVNKEEFIKETLQYMDGFSNVLKEILNFELSNGNLVSSASKGWPKDNSIFIMLTNKFNKKYTTAAYQELLSPHYNWAEYSHTELYILASPLPVKEKP